MSAHARDAGVEASSCSAPLLHGHPVSAPGSSERGELHPLLAALAQAAAERRPERAVLAPRRSSRTLALLPIERIHEPVLGARHDFDTIHTCMYVSQRRPSAARTRSALLESAARGSRATATTTSSSSEWQPRPDTPAGRSSPVHRQGGPGPGGESSGSTRTGCGRSVSPPTEPDPVAELIALARGHAVFCRRDIARVVMAMRLEFSSHDHLVGLR